MHSSRSRVSRGVFSAQRNTPNEFYQFPADFPKQFAISAADGYRIVLIHAGLRPF